MVVGIFSHHLSKYLDMRKNKNIFITSDIWFNRPIGEFSSMTNEEYNSMIIDNWNNDVNEDDIVYILGGFGIGDCYDIILAIESLKLKYKAEGR